MRILVAAVALAAVVLSPAVPCRAAPPEKSVHLAALQGDLATVRAHIREGTDLDAKDPFGSTPLIIAATFGRDRVAAALVDAGVDLERTNNDGSTALHTAAFLCRERIVDDLLEHGANRHARNNFGNSPYDSVIGPFEDVRAVYEQMAQGLAPMGFALDLERIRADRPRIADALRPGAEVLEGVVYEPAAEDGWPVATPESHGIDPALIAELYLDAASTPNMYSVLVVKDGDLIAERYFNGAAADQSFRMASVTKSVTSALTGIALDRGDLTSTSDPVLRFFPEMLDRVTDARKRDITVGHLLQMRGGYPWEETAPELWDALLTGHYAPCLESIGLVNNPGTGFNYSNPSSNWLGIILARASGEDLRDYAQRYLFAPLGAQAGDWGTDAEGHRNGCGNLHLTARDAARFGQLYLDGGAWRGDQIVPADWVSASLENYSPDAWIVEEGAREVRPYFRDLGYGYQWWSATIGPRRVDFAWGHGGQLIVLIHDLDMVVVATSEPFFLQHDQEAWRHERATLNTIGKFVSLLPEG